MKQRGVSILGLAACSLFFQNCGRSFEFIDPVAKSELLTQRSVFQGKATYIYLHKAPKLRALEDRNDLDTEGEIPVTGPNGEGVIIITEPGVFGPGSGVIPVGAGSAMGEVSVVDGVARGPNWYVPPPVVTITTTPGPTNGGGEANIAALFGAFMGMIGAMGNAPSGNTVTNYQSYAPTNNSGGGGVNCAANDTHCQEFGIPMCADRNNVESDPNYWAGKCHSPLLIAFNEDHDEFRSFELTNPVTDGRWFDIAGARAKPAPHTKLKISWLKKKSYLFITLPNAAGEVKGVDELFGNNTRGPDGRFAPNGYEALRKFDENGDGYISAKDSIFPRLRLWNDENADAIATPDELLPLADRQVEVIDLHYNARYIEADRYGNLTALKSAIRTSDGRLHLLFDLWFRVP
ncbi:MAG: hypothetical protein KF767_02805 [Bdellovibrionaceae bacterium]|nr:hypothetical protein [Pseudobdellovibrionaceae bacterium]